MIRSLQLRDTGPTRALDFEFAPRLNVLTGDNGLGKSFVLDVLWWVMTNTWVGEKAFPWRPPRDWIGDRQALRPHIQALTDDHAEQHTAGEVHHSAIWRWDRQRWGRTGLLRRPDSEAHELLSSELEVQLLTAPGLVLFSRIDGSFAVWDTNEVGRSGGEIDDVAVLMTAAEVWEGKTTRVPVEGRTKIICRGLIEDWVSWQLTGAPEFDALLAVLEHLSEPGEPLIPGKPTRVHLDDRRDIPTLELASGEVPVTLASAGVRRVLSLAYLMVWTWSEHVKAMSLMNRAPSSDMLVLIDEVELHLHPRWQRSLLPAILTAVKALSGELKPQLIVTTHSPIVLASLESIFDDEAQDDLFVIEQNGDVIRVRELPFIKEGDVAGWLASEVFGGVGSRPREAELAVEAAQHLMADRVAEAGRSLKEMSTLLHSLQTHQTERGRPALLNDAQAPLLERVHAALAEALPGHDSFWVRWEIFRDLARQEGGSDAPRP